MFGEIDFESLGKFAAGEHDAPPATLALKPNIRAETRDDPFI